jgi:predicted YcjX-like family ATPase
VQQALSLAYSYLGVPIMVGSKKGQHVDLKQCVRSALAQLVERVHSKMEMNDLTISVVAVANVFVVRVTRDCTERSVAATLHVPVISSSGQVGDLRRRAARLGDLPNDQGVECSRYLRVLHRRR